MLKRPREESVKTRTEKTQRGWNGAVPVSNEKGSENCDENVRIRKKEREWILKRQGSKCKSDRVRVRREKDGEGALKWPWEENFVGQSCIGKGQRTSIVGPLKRTVSALAVHLA
ncbi:hypothetical protein Ancab_009968 [Ancistrocladus abbreviatus]